MNKNGYSLYRCGVCDVGMTDLKRDYKTFLRDHYNAGYFTGDPRSGTYTNYQHDKPLIQKNMSRVLSAISARVQSGTLLDVGCSMGYFVELARIRGFDAYGIDPSSYALQHAHPSVSGFLTNAILEDVSESKRTYDVITLFDVFEHFADPVKNIGIIRRMLRKNGRIVIVTGDTASLTAKILGRRWTFYCPPQHLFFFSKNSLSKLLISQGFEIERTFRIGKWLSMQYVFHLARTEGESAVARLLYPLVAGSFIGRIPVFLYMADNIVVIAKKRDELSTEK